MTMTTHELAQQLMFFPNMPVKVNADDLILPIQDLFMEDGVVYVDTGDVDYDNVGIYREDIT